MGGLVTERQGHLASLSSRAPLRSARPATGSVWLPHAGADAMRRIMEAAGLAREDDGGSLSAGPARRAAGTRGQARKPDPRGIRIPGRPRTALYGDLWWPEFARSGPKR